MKAVDDVPTVKGHWLIEAYEGDIVRGPDGEILNRKVETLEGDNLVVTAGKDLLLDRLFALNSTPAAIVDCGVGTDSTAAAVGQTKLNPSVSGSVLLQAFDSLPTRTNEVVTCITTFATGTANFSWNELGLFNGGTNGTSTMFNRIAPIGPFNKTSAVSIVVTVTITQS